MTPIVFLNCVILNLSPPLMEMSEGQSGAKTNLNKK